MMSDEEWLKAAMADDTMVVDLLIRLNTAATPPSKRGSPPATFPLDWSVRQRRSKPMVQARKPTPRASPTTPLSWSCATSVSGGGAAAVDGYEESSRPPPPRRLEDTRSKVNAFGETTASKRSRKKKTLAELKEAEIFLAKERRHLKRELANLRVTMENQRATNESLKRLKLNLQLQSVAERVPTVASEQQTFYQTQPNIVACPIPSIMPPSITGDDLDASQKSSPPLGLSEKQVVVKPENNFFLPDLNMPLEDDLNSEVLYGMS